jgi:hypothetical protein
MNTYSLEIIIKDMNTYNFEIILKDMNTYNLEIIVLVIRYWCKCT